MVEAWYHRNISGSFGILSGSATHVISGLAAERVSSSFRIIGVKGGDGDLIVLYQL